MRHSNSLLTEQWISIQQMSFDLSYYVKWHLSSSCGSLLSKCCIHSLSPSVFFQFYKCFLILFHCSHWSADNGNTSVPSKITVIQLNRRACSNTVACADTLKQCCSTNTNTIPTKNTSTIEVKLSWSRRKARGKPLSKLSMYFICDVPVFRSSCACVHVCPSTTGPAQAVSVVPRDPKIAL